MTGFIALGVILAILLLVVLYAVVIRPWQLQWGATDEELQAELPGDSLLPTATGQITHAISIHSSAEDVWPWLVQMGQGRGGFYSYTWLENLVGCQMKDADHINPEWQHLQIGDPVRLHPKYSLFVHAIEQNRALVLANCPRPQEGQEEGEVRTETAPSSLGLPILETSNHPNFIWAFVLEQKSDRHTRLIVRVRVDPKLSLANLFRSLLFVEPAHFIMERKMLLGIKRRVEQGIDS